MSSLTFKHQPNTLCQNALSVLLGFGLGLCRGGVQFGAGKGPVEQLCRLPEDILGVRAQDDQPVRMAVLPGKGDEAPPGWVVKPVFMPWASLR